MSLFEIGMIIILVTFCVMLIVNRICKCAEVKAMSNAFAASAVAMNPNEMRKILERNINNLDGKEQ